MENKMMLKLEIEDKVLILEIVIINRIQFKG